MQYLLKLGGRHDTGLASPLRVSLKGKLETESRHFDLRGATFYVPAIRWRGLKFEDFERNLWAGRTARLNICSAGGRAEKKQIRKSLQRLLQQFLM